MGRCITGGYGMTKLTESHLKVLKYLSKRKTEATFKDIQLQTRLGISTTKYVIRALLHDGYIEKRSERLNRVTERFYTFASWEPVAKESVKNPIKFTKTRITIEPKFFNNPFSMSAS
jgi:predicted transcriptional regulator